MERRRKRGHEVSVEQEQYQWDIRTYRSSQRTINELNKLSLSICQVGLERVALNRSLVNSCYISNRRITVCFECCHLKEMYYEFHCLTERLRYGTLPLSL